MPNLMKFHVNCSYHKLNLDHLPLMFNTILSALKEAAPKMTMSIETSIIIQAISFDVLEKMMGHFMLTFYNLRECVQYLKEDKTKVHTVTLSIYGVCPFHEDFKPGDWMDRILSIGIEGKFTITENEWTFVKYVDDDDEYRSYLNLDICNVQTKEHLNGKDVNILEMAK